VKRILLKEANRMRTLIRPITLIISLLCLSLQSLPCGRLIAGELRRDLADHLEILPGQEMVSVIVYLNEQADISALDLELKQEKASRQVRHERVIRALKEVAARTQPDLVDHLDAARARGDVTGFTPHWIANLVVVEATVEEIVRLRNHPQVDFIEPNFTARLIEQIPTGIHGYQETGLGASPGLRAINADRVWYELGITGAGRVIASFDTGVEGTHPAMASRWRGLQPGVDPSEAWMDIVHEGTDFPYDSVGHGTHVTGIVTGMGGATGDTVGVAWGALWIACNGVEQDRNPEFDNEVIMAFEWFADPDGDPGTVDDVPDVVQNAWGTGSIWPGYEDCDSRWWDVIDYCEAAGVAAVWAAGNGGPDPYTSVAPANRPTTPTKNFAIGAVDATMYDFPYPITRFSARGPSPCDSVSIKPEVVTPGHQVRSSVIGGGYEQWGWSGTSQASPHASGVIALLREANPDLTSDEVKEVLMNTAHDFGEPGEENIYGMGFVDAYEAVLSVMIDIGTLTGTVTDSITGEPVPARLKVIGSVRRLNTDPDTGTYAFTLPGDSTYTVQASGFGYETMQQEVFVPVGETATLDFALTLLPRGSVAGIVMEANDGLPVDGARVEILDVPIPPVISGPRGEFQIDGIPGEATYLVEARAHGYGMNDEEISVRSGEQNLLSLPLETGFFDNMDDDVVCSNCHEWIHYPVSSGYHDQWNRSTRRSHTAGGTTAWKCGSMGDDEYGSFLDAALETATFELHEGAKLLFWHFMRAEVSYDDLAFDGGIVEISLDGGPWEQIFPVEGYPFRIWWGYANPLPPETPCFSGSHDWRQEEFDLTGYAGAAKIRFRFATTHSNGYEGWYIDDVVAGTDPTAPRVSILMLPEEAEIVIGPSGGSFAYDIALINNTEATQTVDWWIDVTLPDGTLSEPMESHREVLAPAETIRMIDNVQGVPADAPDGEYIYHGKVGKVPNVVNAISSIPFTKGTVTFQDPPGIGGFCPRKQSD
jgi:subtilisin family serine protease